MPLIHRIFSLKSAFILVSALLLGIVIYFTQIYWSEEEVSHFITQFGPLGFVIYVALVVIFNVLAPLSATPVMLLGFSLFQHWAIWLFALGNMIAMIINFWLARRYGRGLIKRIVGEESMDKVDEVAKDYGLLALFMARLFLSGISDLTSYAFGLTQIRFKPYIIISVIASLPPYILFTILSNENQTSVQSLLLQLIIAGILSATYLVSRYIFQRFMRLLLKGY